VSIPVDGRYFRAGCRDPELPRHEVLARHVLRDRVLDLEPGVHLHEVEGRVVRAPARVEDELDGSRTPIPDRPGSQQGRLAQGRAQRGVDARCRRLFDDLLMAPLQRAVAFEEVDRVAVMVREDLHLDVPGPRQELLDQHALVPEGGPGLPARAGQRRLEVPLRIDATHAAPTAPGHGLHEHRIADVPRGPGEGGEGALIIGVPGDHRDAGLLHQRLGGVLAPHGPDRLGGRTHEDESRGLARLREVGVLGEESVAGMHRLRPAGARNLQDALLTQIALGGGRRADAPGLVRHAHVAGVGIRFGVHRDRAHAQTARRLRDATGDLSAVRDEQGVEHAFPRPTSGTRRSGSAPRAH
jgi:hypothetical protein